MALSAAEKKLLTTSDWTARRNIVISSPFQHA